MIANLNIVLWIVFGVSLTALVYAQAIYPLLMALVSRRKVAVPDVREWPTVSLIIPAHNESIVIDDKLENSLAIDYPADRLEIIVASDGSTDGTVTHSQQFDTNRVKVLELSPRRGKAATVNRAVEVATGDVLCLCDANVMFEPSALGRLVRHFASDSVGAVTGDVRLESHQSSFGAGESLYYRIERAVQWGESKLNSTICVDGGMYVIRRGLFQPLPEDTVLDDFTTTMHVLRQGYRVRYEPTAVAHENGTPSASAEYRRRSRVMRGAMQALARRQWPRWNQPVLLWEFFSHKLLRWLSPVLLITLLATSVLLWQQSAVVRVFAVAQIGLYMLALLATVVPRSRDFPVMGIAFYFCLSHLAMLDGFWRALRSRSSGVWERTDRTTPDPKQPPSSPPSPSEERPVTSNQQLV